MSNINYSQEIEDAKEEFILNNIHLTSLPSDILAFTNNAVVEETFMRSLAVFSIRSKYAKGKVILTFPISINPHNNDPAAIESRDQGFEIATQASNYPFVFIKSKRVYSYISDKAKKSSTGFMMFAVDELKVSQHVDVQDILFLELSLVYCDHSSQVQDFTFIKDPANPQETTEFLSNSPIFSSFVANMKDKTDNNIFETYNDLEDVARTKGLETEFDVPLSRVVLFAPDILAEGDPEAAALSLANTETGSEDYKKVSITSHVGDMALTSLLLNDSNNEELDEDDTVSGKFSMDTMYVVHRAFHDLNLGGDSAITKIVCSRKNKLATLFVGGNQNPFIQYLGRYPARVEVDMLFNNKNVYKHSLESTIAAVNSLSSIISYNNSEFPEMSAYNTLKIKSLASASLGILNIVPNQTSIQATSNSHGMEALTVTFVESDMEEFLKVGNVINGRTVQLADSAKIRSLTTYLENFSKGSTDSTKSVDLNLGNNADLHKSVLQSLYSTYQPIKTEIMAGGIASDDVLREQSVGLKSLDNFPKTVNAAYIKKVVDLLKLRSGVMDLKKNEDKLIIDGKETTAYVEYEGRQADVKDTYRQNGMVDSIIQTAYYQIAALSQRGDELANKIATTLGLQDVSSTVNAQIFNYTGTNIPDINLDLVGNQNEKDIRNMNPFFFINGTSYYDKDDIIDAASLADESVQSLMDSVINKQISDQLGEDMNGIPGFKFLRDERVIGETTSISGGSYIADAGIPSGGVGFSTSGFTNWVTIPAKAPVMEQVRTLIARIVPTVGIPADQVPSYIRYFIQIAGIESGLGQKLQRKGSGYVGIFQLGVDYIKDTLGVSEAQARAGWNRARTDHEYNIRIAINGIMKGMNKAQKDGLGKSWIGGYVYHQQGFTGGMQILRAYKAKTSCPQRGSTIKGNMPPDYPIGRSGSAEDVIKYIEYYTKYINTAVYAKESVNNKPNLGNDSLSSSNKIITPPKDLKDKTIAVKVSRVVDGDTIHVIMPDGKTEELRFANIDAPETAHSGIITVPTQVVVDGKTHTLSNLSWSEPGQLYGPFATQELIRIGVKPNSTVLIDKNSIVNAKNDVYERVITNIYLSDGTDVLYEMVKRGAAMPLNTRDRRYQEAYETALKNRIGMWSGGAATQTPKQFRDLVAKKAREQSLVDSARKQLQARNPQTKPKDPEVKPEVKGTFRTTNQMLPVSGTPAINSGFGYRGINYGSNDHKGLDLNVRETQVFAIAPGIASVLFDPPKPGKNGRPTQAGFGTYVRIDHQNGFASYYAHLASAKVSNGQRVSMGQLIGISGNSGLGRVGGYHLHYEVRRAPYTREYAVHPFYTTPLKDIPLGTSDTLKYVDKAFKNKRFNSKWLGRPSNESTGQGGNGVSYDQVVTEEGVNSSNSSEVSMNYDPSSHDTEPRNIDYEYSVFNEKQQIKLQADNMSYLQKYGLNIAYPVIKAYITVGNENEDVTIGSFVRLDQYFEITGIEDFKLECNNDNNPIDLVTMTLANPSFIRQDNYSIMGHFLKSDFTQFGTDLESQFIGDRLTLRAGMKLHIRMGYGNDPNKLKTVFNGSISDMSNGNNSTVSVICEGFGKELVNYYISPGEVTKAGGTVTNSSSPIVIGAALQSDSIAHFGERASFWKAAIGTSVNSLKYLSPIVALGNAVINMVSKPDEERTVAEASNSGSISGDNKKDPESKRLTNMFGSDSLLLLNFSMSDYKQRLFTNIYAAEIEYSHSEYASSFWNYIGNLFSSGHKAGYHYLFYNTTPWQAVKEMEYRHPGTFAKPLMYDDRMSVFYGIKEQMYIARDLDPVFMAMSAAESTFSKEYLSQRPKRFDVACGFHMLSTNTNIIANNMGINSKYYTGVNVLYFDSAGDLLDEGGRETFQIKLDDDIVSWDMRYKTVGYNGTHGRYSAWMYGTQELKREAETMYGGKITLVGNPAIKAGDYAYINDDLRKISGIVKIRECTHTMNSRDGFITEIVPGQYVEAKEFIYSMLFFKLGFASKLVFASSELAMKHTANGDEIFNQYKSTLQLLGSWTPNRGLFGYLPEIFENGSLPTVGLGSMIGLLLLSAEFYGRKRGWHFAAASTLATAKSFGQLGVGATKYLLTAKYGEQLAKTRALVASGIQKGATVARSSTLLKMATATAKLPLKLLGIPPKLVTGATTFAVFKAAKTLANVASVASVALLTNPLGWLLKIAGTIVLSHVMMKIEENSLTRQPLLLFPVNLLGRPYQAGARGYQRNTWLESKANNLDRNIKNVNKAATMVSMASSNNVQKYVANFIVKNTANPTKSEEILKNAADKANKTIKEGE